MSLLDVMHVPELADKNQAMSILQKRSSIFRKPPAPLTDASSIVDAPVFEAPIVDAPQIHEPAVETAAPPMPDAIDRREKQRIRQQCHAEISPWVNNKAGVSFTVVLDNVSTAGVGLMHSGRLQIGSRYLLEIARPGQAPFVSLFTVVRCDASDGGLFDVELAADEVLETVYSIVNRRNSVAANERKRGPWRIVAIIAAFTIAAASVLLNLI